MANRTNRRGHHHNGAPSRTTKIINQVKSERATEDNNNSDVTIAHSQPSKKQFEFYECGKTFQMKPYTERFLDELCVKLVDWAANDEDALKISQFRLKEGFALETYQQWMEKYPKLRRAHSQALELIGNRREILGLKKRLDSGLVSTSMPLYDSSWRELHAWKSKLRSEENINTGPQIVVIEKFPNSDVVPEKT